MLTGANGYFCATLFVGFIDAVESLAFEERSYSRVRILVSVHRANISEFHFTRAGRLKIIVADSALSTTSKSTVANVALKAR
jgi:hypothetical protein